MKTKLELLYRVVVRFIAHCSCPLHRSEVSPRESSGRIVAEFTLLSILMPYLCYAAFEDLGAGARVLGMGDAFVALADDLNASYYNPAGLVQLKDIEIQATYAGYYLGLTEGIGDGFIGYGQKLKDENGALGMSYLERRASDIYKEITFTASYAKGFKEEKFSLGASLKYRYKSYRTEYNMSDPSQLDPVFKRGSSAYGVSVDIGFLYRPADFFSFGIFAGDINQPDINLLDKDVVPMSFKMGISYRFGEGKDYTINLDGLYRDGDYSLSLGLENWLMLETGEFDLRGASQKKNQMGWRTGFSTGTNGYKNFSAGMSYRLGSPDIQIDYAFIYPLSGIKNIWGTHRLAMIMRLENTE